MDPNPLIADVNLDQIGIVVPDLHTITDELTRLFGIGPWRITEWPLADIEPEATYHGQEGNFRLLLAFAMVGNTQLEIIQPLDGENIFSDFLRDHGPGLHHIRLNTPEFEEGVSALINAGINKMTSGTGVHYGSKWAYFDTSKLLGGVLVELRSRLKSAGKEGQWVQSKNSSGE